MTKSFMLLLAVTLGLGIAFGGVFAGGVALGKTQEGTTAPVQEANSMLQQIQNQSHRGGLTGVIEKLDGTIVTVNTSRGPLSASLGEETTIWRIADGTPSDLQPGMRITLVGQSGVDGIVEARSVLLNPDEASGFFDTNFLFRDSQREGQFPQGDAEFSAREDQEHSPNPGGFFFGGGQQHGRSSGGDGGSSGHP